jgi:predicted NACHT family NTPase
MVRKVQQINIALRRGGPEEPRPFSDFAASQSVVLLGDPGAGKSHLFRETADAEGARFVSARTFLVTPTQRLKGQRQRDLWLTAAYMLAPNEYQAVVEREAKARPGLVFDLRDRSGFAHHGQPGENALSLAQLEFMARLTGALYPAASPPSSVWGVTPIRGTLRSISAD